MAEWINKEVFAFNMTAECSACGETTTATNHDNGWGIDYIFPKHCPNCGSKMDGDDKFIGEDVILDEEEASAIVAFIKNHERDEIPDDVWDICMKLMDKFDMC